MKKVNPKIAAPVVAILLLIAAFGGGLGDFARTLGGLFWFAMFAALYFLPWIIAWRRNHHNTLAIFVLNLLCGWTVVGWVAALVWAVTASVPVVLVQQDSSTAR